MEEKPGRLKEQLVRSLTSRFESNHELKERLASMQEGEGASKDEEFPGCEEGSAALPTVEDMHAKMLTGIRKNIETPEVKTPHGKKAPGPKDVAGREGGRE